MPNFFDIRMAYGTYEVQQMPGDGNCLTHCVLELHNKIFGDKKYEIGNLKTALFLKTATVLASETDAGNIEVFLKTKNLFDVATVGEFMKTYGGNRLGPQWLNVLKKFDTTQNSIDTLNSKDCFEKSLMGQRLESLQKIPQGPTF